eukprot:TRINITY_DN15421_c0_g1_i3.p1 TRINITY_DN15421_c0_g1~~TRINITY_DN15421_c0_g1_i3.p1  ORF type:complete len:235 (-),score=56.35 TRINITY_DN15421_c0_g1_i3:333-1037(-)
MASSSRATFAVRCFFGDFELPVTSPERQVQLLRHLSHACSDFLKDLTPEEAALAEMVQKGIDSMARLKEMASANSREEEGEVNTEAEGGISSTNTSAFSNKDDKDEAKPPLPKRKARKVTFRSYVERHTYSKSSDDEVSNEEDWCPPVRSPGFFLGDVDKQKSSSKPFSESKRDASQSDKDVAKNPSGFQPIMPDNKETASRSVSARLRAAMKEVHLPSFRTSRGAHSQQVCPE